MRERERIKGNGTMRDDAILVSFNRQADAVTGLSARIAIIQYMEIHHLLSMLQWCCIDWGFVSRVTPLLMEGRGDVTAETNGITSFIAIIQITDAAVPPRQVLLVIPLMLLLSLGGHLSRKLRIQLGRLIEDQRDPHQQQQQQMQDLPPVVLPCDSRSFRRPPLPASYAHCSSRNSSRNSSSSSSSRCSSRCSSSSIRTPACRACGFSVILRAAVEGTVALGVITRLTETLHLPFILSLFYIRETPACLATGSPPVVIALIPIVSSAIIRIILIPLLLLLLLLVMLLQRNRDITSSIRRGSLQSNGDRAIPGLTNEGSAGLVLHFFPPRTVAEGPPGGAPARDVTMQRMPTLISPLIHLCCCT